MTGFVVQGLLCCQSATVNKGSSDWSTVLELTLMSGAASKFKIF